MSLSASFSGSIPRIYDTVMGPVTFEPFAIETARRVPASMDLLEIGAGTGRVTAHLAENIPPGGRLLATDLKEGMLAIAQEKIKNPAVRFAIVDAQELPYDAEEFDNVVCQYVAMFFTERVKAFSHFKRVLKPGGKLFMAVWGTLEQNPYVLIQEAAANHFLPEDQHISVMKDPFSYNDEAEIEKDLWEAGFSDVKFEWVEKEFRASSVREYMTGVFNGSRLATALDELGITDKSVMIDLAAKNFAEKYGDPAVTTMTSLFIEAG